MPTTKVGEALEIVIWEVSEEREITNRWNKHDNKTKKKKSEKKKPKSKTQGGLLHPHGILLVVFFCPRLPSFPSLSRRLCLYHHFSHTQVHQMEKIVEMGAPSEDRLLDKM